MSVFEKSKLRRLQIMGGVGIVIGLIMWLVGKDLYEEGANGWEYAITLKGSGLVLVWIAAVGTLLAVLHETTSFFALDRRIDSGACGSQLGVIALVVVVLLLVVPGLIPETTRRENLPPQGQPELVAAFEKQEQHMRIFVGVCILFAGGVAASVPIRRLNA